MPRIEINDLTIDLSPHDGIMSMVRVQKDSEGIVIGAKDLGPIPVNRLEVSELSKFFAETWASM